RSPPSGSGSVRCSNSPFGARGVTPRLTTSSRLLHRLATQPASPADYGGRACSPCPRSTPGGTVHLNASRCRGLALGIALAGVAAAPAAIAADPQPTLLARAVLPAATFADGPPSGAAL